MKKAIVTGANGFVGTALCKELIKNGTDVIAVVRNTDSSIEGIKDLSGIRIVYCDISDFNNLDKYIVERDFDVLFHLAWEGSAGTLRGNVEVQIDNVKHTCELIETCHRLKCPRIVFASSIMEYEIHALMGTDMKPGINTLYSSAKVAANYMARAVAANLGIEYISAIISNIYGPGEMSPRLINSSIRKLLRSEHCAFSEGDQLYDFIYIDDAARAFVMIGEAGLDQRSYYIGSSQPKPLKNYLCQMRDVVAPSVELGLGEIAFVGVSLRYTEFDVDGLKKDTGFEPEVSFPEGIRRTTKWICEEMKDGEL